MKHTKQDERGGFARSDKYVSDEDLWAAYIETPNSEKLGKKLDLHPGYIRTRLAKIRHKMGASVTTEDVDRAGKLEQLVSSIPLKGPGGATLHKANVKIYGMGAKDELTQTLITKGMDSTGVEYRLEKNMRWPEIAPVTVSGYKSAERIHVRYKRVMFIGDAQLGFWAQLNPSDPFEVTFIPFFGDGSAIDVVLRAIAIYKPDVIVIIGDFFDFAQFSRFQQEPAFEFTLQAAFCFGRAVIAQIRASAGDKCEIHFIPGNHETRLARSVINQLRHLWEVRRPGETEPLLALKHILQLDDLGIEMASEFPSGEVWVHPPKGRMPGLIGTHAPLVGNGARDVFRANQVHGHLVLAGLTTKPVFDYCDETKRTEIVTTWAACCSGTGNYSDTTNKIRVTRTMTPSGRAKMSFNNALVTVDINKKTDAMQPHVWYMDRGAMEFYGGTVVGKPIDPREYVRLRGVA